MKLNKVFQTAEVPIPDRSGFDLSREHLFTAPVGTLVPAECFEVLPNDTISMGSMMKVTLPPFAVPFMGRVDACLEAFFVPSRILWKGWQAFITQNQGIQNQTGLVPTSVPRINLNDTFNVDYLGANSLADYLGVMQAGLTDSDNVSAMKFLAYHMIIDHWYRDQNNVKPFFVKSPTSYVATSNELLEHIINSVQANLNNTVPLLQLYPRSAPGAAYLNLCDYSIGLGDLRQRSWAKDYFTTATTRPQAGDAAQITFSTAGQTGSITVSDIRVAGALQRWLERNNISGTDYGSQILAHFGVTPPDAIMDKPILLGQVREPVYVGSVENNSNAEPSSYQSTNPFGTTLGTAAGMGSAFGKGSLIPKFHAKEHGYIMVMYSLVPHAYYDAGVDREMLHMAIGDYAWPEYAHIGDQAILRAEIKQDGGNYTDIFGYNQRYSEYKFRLDKVSGRLHEGQNLDVYALKRSFRGTAAGTPALGKEFLEIPKDYLDQVSQVDYKVSKYGCIVDTYFDTRAIRLLPEYSLPKI